MNYYINYLIFKKYKLCIYNVSNLVKFPMDSGMTPFKS